MERKYQESQKLMRVLSLFSGIGAHDLGLEWAGMQIVGQVEIDEYCQTILKKHWPKVKRWTDITTVPIDDLRRLKPDLITGGFPCQDISTAGKQKGIIEGERSSLWREMWRIIRELRPAWVLIENVPALRTKGADGIFASMEAISYTGWPLVVGAEHAGASHRRKRLWYVAHRNSERREAQRRICLSHEQLQERDHSLRCSTAEVLTDSDGNKIWKQPGRSCGACGSNSPFAGSAYEDEHHHDWESPRALKSEVGSRVHGTSRRLAIKALGNANPPQVVAMIGRAIMHVNETI